jgi:hypothetical protein
LIPDEMTEAGTTDVSAETCGSDMANASA